MDIDVQAGLALLLKYFPNLTDEQYQQFAQLAPLYSEWNARINVISRKDIGNLYERHVLHSLSIAKFVDFMPGTVLLDVGTGGGFPGLPLAILYPDVFVHLIDGTAKKIKVVHAIINALGLTNARAQHIRVEHLRKRQYDFIVSRAVAPLTTQYRWGQRLIRSPGFNSVPNGILSLKGGNVQSELDALPKGIYREANPLSAYIDTPWFAQDKYLLYVQVE